MKDKKKPSEKVTHSSKKSVPLVIAEVSIIFDPKNTNKIDDVVKNPKDMVSVIINSY